MSVLTMAKEYNKRPSEVIFIDDPYTAYCFDEACSFILEQWDYENNKWKVKPIWKEEKEKKNNKAFINSIRGNQ